MCYKTQALNLSILLFLLRYQKRMNARENYEREIEIDGNEMRGIERET